MWGGSSRLENVLGARSRLCDPLDCGMVRPVHRIRTLCRVVQKFGTLFVRFIASENIHKFSFFSLSESGENL